MKATIRLNTDLLSATVTGTPATGTYPFTPVRTAQSHQLISSGVASSDQALGGGSLKFRFGGFTDRGMNLELLNGGAGVERGKIRITRPQWRQRRDRLAICPHDR